MISRVVREELIYYFERLMIVNKIVNMHAYFKRQMLANLSKVKKTFPSHLTHTIKIFNKIPLS